MPPNDPYATVAPGFNAPSADYFAITKGDTSAADFPTVSRAIRVGTSGDVVAIRPDGTPVTFKNCAAGEILPIRAMRVSAASTAADLVALC